MIKKNSQEHNWTALKPRYVHISKKKKIAIIRKIDNKTLLSLILTDIKKYNNRPYDTNDFLKQNIHTLYNYIIDNNIKSLEDFLPKEIFEHSKNRNHLTYASIFFKKNNLFPITPLDMQQIIVEKLNSNKLNIENRYRTYINIRRNIFTIFFKKRRNLLINNLNNFTAGTFFRKNDKNFLNILENHHENIRFTIKSLLLMIKWNRNNGFITIEWILNHYNNWELQKILSFYKKLNPEKFQIQDLI